MIPAMRRAALTEIANILGNVYGVGMTVASESAVHWAASKCKNPEVSLEELNKIRTKHGAPFVYSVCNIG